MQVDPVIVYATNVAKASQYLSPVEAQVWRRLLDVAYLDDSSPNDNLMLTSILLKWTLEHGKDYMIGRC